MLRIIYFTSIGIIFLAFAVVQYNDPDPYVWMPLYLLVAGIQFYRIRKNIHPLILILLTGFYLGMSFGWSFQVTEWSIMVEEVNETLGLLLAGIFTGLALLPGK